MARNKIAFGLSAVLFLVLAGTGVSSAYWGARDTATTTVAAASVADNCTSIATLVNGSFEAPQADNITMRNDVTGWTTSDSGIEVWGGTINGMTGATGRQWIELNSNAASTVSQVFNTVPGQTLSWGLSHRGRDGIDTMDVRIGAGSATLGAAAIQSTFSDGNTAWARRTGVYVVPVGQTQTKFSIVSGATANNSATIGNFVDDISIGTGPCLTATSTVSNITAPGVAPKVGDRLQYVTTVKNVGGAPSASTVFSDILPTNLGYVGASTTFATITNRLPVDTAPVQTAMTDAADGDLAEYAAATVTGRLGAGATSTAGGTIEPGFARTVTVRATVAAGAGGSTITYAPTVSYTDPLAPQWPVGITATPLQTAVTAAPVDSTPPGAPVIAASNTTTTQTTLSWPAVSDNVGVTGYVVYRAGIEIATVTGPNYTDVGLVPGTVYRYTVKARDAAGNLSAASNELIVTTPYVATSYYRIANPNSGLCVNANTPSNQGNGTVLTMLTCSSTAAGQKWRFTPTGDGYYANAPSFSPGTTGSLAWDIDGGSKLAQLWAYGGTANQQWSVVTEASGTSVRFVNRGSSNCLDMANTTSGTQLRERACDNSVRQSFTLTPTT